MPPAEQGIDRNGQPALRVCRSCRGRFDRRERRPNRDFSPACFRLLQKPQRVARKNPGAIGVRNLQLGNWDRTTINLPFGRGAVVGIEEVHVPPDADAETMERCRLKLETILNEATRRAYEMVGRPEGGARG